MRAIMGRRKKRGKQCEGDASTVGRLPADLTLIIIEQDMDLVLNLVDRVTCLHNGQVIADEPVATIRHNPRVQEIYLGVG